MPNFTAHKQGRSETFRYVHRCSGKYVVPGREQDVLTTAKESMDIHRAYFGGHGAGDGESI